MSETATAVATRQENAPQPVSETAAILSVIERAARDPNVDIDKMERLLNMQERVMARNAKAAYVEALAAMQPGLPIIEERGEIKISENKPGQRYALWDDINEAIKPVLAEHGFALSFRTGQAEGKITVTGILSHREGHSEETTMHLPADTSGSKNAVQAVGSSTSYGKRYTAMALLNLTSRFNEDDDAESATDLITADQVKQLRSIADEVGADVPKFCKYLRVESLAAIPAVKFQQAMTALAAKQKGARRGDS